MTPHRAHEVAALRVPQPRGAAAGRDDERGRATARGARGARSPIRRCRSCWFSDEPTNHLDLEAIEELEKALAAYDGAILVVSHDQAFLEVIGVERTVGLG